MDTVAIISYFNFSRQKAREIALRQTLRYLSRQVDVILVCYGLMDESIFSEKRVHIVHVQSASRVWQKERFNNIALLHIKKNHKYIIWVDADVIFVEPDWLVQLKDRLISYRLVQLFNKVIDVSMVNNRFTLLGLNRKSVIESLYDDISPESYFGQSGISLQLGCNPGMAWGARVETIKKIGFCDFMIMGSGDKLLLASAMGYYKMYSELLHLNESLRKLSLEWGKRVFQVVEGKVFYLENTIYHLVQGNYDSRNYPGRYQLIKDDGFVFHDYLNVNEYASWQWKNSNNRFASIIESYFSARKD